VGDRIAMLQFSTYSVISPEGCASILWKDASKAQEAAIAMGITAVRLKELGLIDDIIQEPLGGAHRAPAEMAVRLRDHLMQVLEELDRQGLDELLARRFERLMKVGSYTEAG
jgi:acetyl-CoA carboxylase carboxyl transferase subunit alpha